MAKFWINFVNIFMNFGQIWAFVSSQIIKNILAIWSHWKWQSFKKVGGCVFSKAGSWGGELNLKLLMKTGNAEILEDVE